MQYVTLAKLISSPSPFQSLLCRTVLFLMFSQLYRIINVVILHYDISRVCFFSLSQFVYFLVCSFCKRIVYSNRRSVLYVLESDGRTKIGITFATSLIARTRQNQTGNPNQVKASGVWVFANKAKCFAAEKMLHDTYREYRDGKGGTEWFAFGEKHGVIIEEIADFCKKMDAIRMTYEDCVMEHFS
jgi:T5orf172 domain